MQKKIIVLAVAGLISGAAFAQSNVTIYGMADAGYVYASGPAPAPSTRAQTSPVSSPGCWLVRASASRAKKVSAMA